jgi:hypothetical protein
LVEHLHQPDALPDRISPYGWDVARRSGVASLDMLRSIDPASRPDRFRRVAQGVAAVERPTMVSASDDWLLRCVQAVGTPVIEAGRVLSAGSEEWQQEAFRQWSTVFDRYRLEPSWKRSGRPSVSVVVATRRPENLDLWAAQVASQTHRPLQVVAALHGAGWTAWHHEHLRQVLEAAGVNVVIVSVDDTAVLGQVLQAGCDRADGAVIVKWDDDDLYSTTHVTDLLRVRHYSGATIVGKASDFVYVQSADTTVRRVQAPREIFSPTLAGGTLAIAPDDLRAVGGWDAVPRDEDLALITKVRRHGGTSYRSVGFGYLMIRRSRPGAHTWNVDDAVFLAAGNPRRAGLDIGWAMIDQPSEIMARAVRDVDGGPRN